MPSIRSLVFKCRTYMAAKILLRSEIIPIYSRCLKKASLYYDYSFFSCQLSSYIKCTKLNMHLSCNI